jgi:hypothetical protein
MSDFEQDFIGTDGVRKFFQVSRKYGDKALRHLGETHPPYGITLALNKQ